MIGRRARTWARWSAMAGTAGLASAFGAGVACADENYHDSPLGPQVALVKVGQVDDPMEDVLEHVSVLAEGHTVS